MSSTSVAERASVRKSQRSATAQESQIPWRLAACLAALLLAYLPVLLKYLPQLWDRPYYRFFPFAMATTFGLAILRGDANPQYEAGRFRWWLRIVAFVAAQGMLLGGIYLGLLWPCFVSFVATMTVLLDLWSEKDRQSTLVYLAVPVLLLVRPPLHMDETIVQQLQTITSQLASSVLSAIPIDHILSGNVIQPLNGPALLVEEACSGVQSLFTLMFIAAFIGTTRHYALIRTLVLMGSAVFWALMMNLFRVVVITIAQTEFNTDLSHGWQHDAVGYLGICMAIVFLLSTDRLAFFFLSSIPDDPLTYKQMNLFVSGWNWLVIGPEKKAGAESERSRGTAPAVEAHAQTFGRSMLAMCWMLGICFLAVLPAYGRWNSEQRVSGADVAELDLSKVDADWLPVTSLSGCSLLSYETEERDRSSDFGEFSNRWLLSDQNSSILHSMDHSFDGWHNLTICYRSVGWRMQKMVLKDAEDAGTPWPVVYAQFLKPTGEHASLCFSLFTVSGEPVQPEGEAGLLDGLKSRIRQAQWGSQQTIQVQSLTESLVAPTQDSIDHLISRHVQVRDLLLQQVRLSASGESSGTADDQGQANQTAGVTAGGDVLR